MAAAEIQAQWGPKSFMVSPGQVVPLTDLTTGYTRKQGNGTDTSGQPTTNTRGIELQKINISTRYVAIAGCNPREEMEGWKGLFGVQYPFFLNGTQLGPDLMELDNVDFSNIMMDDIGRILSVDASISLIEYIPQSEQVSEKKKTSSGKNAGSDSTSSTGSKLDSVNAKIEAKMAIPSEAEKENRKGPVTHTVEEWEPVTESDLLGGDIQL